MIDLVRIPPASMAVWRRLLDAGFNSYLVGGAVRDLYLGRNVRDIDLATEATPDQMKRLFDQTIDTGIRHGTVSVASERGVICEVTTFRTDGPYTDGRRPSYVSFAADIQSDLARRDFTMNAMAISFDGTLVDPFGGRQDLAHGLLRTVGCAEERFREDGLRLLRALRFASTYELRMESGTWAGFQAEATSIRHVARERLGPELLRLADGNWPGLLATLSEARLWAYLPNSLSQLAAGFEFLFQRAKELPMDTTVWPLHEAAIATWCVGVPDGPERASQICLAVALGQRTATRVATLCRLAQDLLEKPDDMWSKARLFGTSTMAAETACDIGVWLHPDKDQALRRAASRAISTQPLWSANDLALDGTDLISLGAQGRQVGEIKRRLIQGVLEGVWQNESLVLRQVAMDMVRKEES